MIITLPESTTYDSDLIHYANILKIPNFHHVKMRDELDGKPRAQECCIINLNKHTGVTILIRMDKPLLENC